MLYQNPYAPPLPAGTFPGVYGDPSAGLAAVGRRKRKGPKAPLARQRWTGNQKRQMPSIARRLPTATKGGARAARQAVATKQAAKAAAQPAKPAPVAVLPPPAFFTEPENIGTPADISPQATMDQAVVGADEYPVDLSTDLFADATAAPGEFTDLDSIIVEESAEPGMEYAEYSSDMQGLGSKLSKLVRKVAPVASIIPGFAAPVNALFPPKAQAPAPAPQPAKALAAPKPATVVRRVAPAQAAKPASNVSPWLIGGGVVAGVALLMSLVSVARK